MLALTVGHGCHWLPLVATVRRTGPSVDISTRRGFLNTMNTLNSMLRRIPLATMVAVALLVLATGTVSAAPRQQDTVDICSRTQEVQDAILAKVSNATCSTITDTQLAGIQYLFTDGYSNTTVIPGDFANLTGLVELGIFDSSALTTVPANAFSEVTGYSNLINVGLVRNVITDVHIDAFEGLFGGLPDGFSGQITLALGNNLIETLEPGVFDGLSNLTNLALSNNNIQNLEPGIFDGLGMLTKLSLANNGLKGLDNAVFRDLPELEILYLGTNKLSGLDAGTFNGLTKLQQLTLTNNGLSVLPAGIFNGLTELRVLHLEANSLTDLDAAIFAGLDDSLWNLYLNSNRLSTLPSGIFAGLTGLQTLDLNNNGISTLPADVFAPLDDSLGAIALSRNSLSSLDADIFDGLTGLEYLHLQGNSLSSLPAGIFDGLTGLQRLYLNDNSLSTLPANVFAPLDDTLQHVYLSNNNLSSLDADTFDGLTGLIGLYIENNDSLSSLPATIFEDLDESLLYLYLGNNSLSSLDADIFDGLTGLQRLYLNDNSLSSLDADIFDGLTALQRLYLNHNSLSSLPATIFEDLDDSLWHLVLTKNTVATLPADIFDGLTGLQGLDLSCNSLNALPLTRFDPFASSLTYLDVSGNGYGSTPSEMALKDKFTQITDMSGSLYTGVNTECLPPYEFGLSGLSLSTGTLNPAFQAPGKDVYNTRVGHDVSSITVTVTPKDSRAMIEPRSGSNWEYDNDEPTPGIQVDLTGVRTDIGWQVRVRNGAFSYPYQIAVYLDPPPATNALLRSLELSGAPLDETFDGRTDTYTATAAASETTVTATPLDPDATTVIKLNGTVDSDGTVVLNVGSNNVITVEVTAEDGTTMQTYTVTVMRTTAPGVSVEPTALTVREEDATGESYTVVLGSRPTSSVEITVAGHSGTDVTPTPTTLTFTTSNWNTRQTVTVTAGNDADLLNDEVTLTHSAASTDGNYNSITIDDVTVTVNDNDTANVAPMFDEGGSTSRAFNETLGDASVSTAGNIGNPVAATDTGDTLTYSLDGMDKAKFGIISTNGQLRTKTGQKYDYEAQSSYSVTVKVEDSQGASDTIAVTLNVMDQDEAPLAPNAPSVSATPGSNNSLDVSWTAPTNTGRPAITNYDLQYQKTTETGWTDGPQNVTGLSATIGDLDTGTEYRVQVRATNAEGGDNWSASGNGSTNTPTNALPTFTEGASTSRDFNETIGDEAVATASNIDNPVTATDTGDTLTYSLDGMDKAKFEIISTNGQLRTKVGEKYSHEEQSSYSVTVKVEDGNSASDTIAVTLNVMDQDEAPLAPNAPSVSATPGSNNSLDVSWTAPTNTGRPAITNYDLQYQKTTETEWTDGPQNVTGLSASIPNLTGGTSYQVQVRARNAEGAVAWSASGTGRTDTPTAPGVSVLPTVLTVTEEDTAGASYTVVLDSQPTADVTVTVAGHSGTEVTPTPTSLTFTTSNWESAQTITVTATDTVTMNDTVTLTHSAASMDTEYNGITIDSVAVTVNDTAAGICGRTPEVRDALVGLIPGVSDCAAVTAADLAAITGPLDLSSQSIDELAAGDFAGLTALETLNLFNNKLTALPDDVFAGLTALNTLNLDHNELIALPDDVFAGLTALKVLYLNYNELTALPDRVFAGLTSLEFLYLGKNEQLTELTVGVFAGLTSLKLLYLDNNGLETLPDGVFAGLISLQVLRLQGNTVASFAPTAEALPDDGTVPVAGGTVTLDGSGSGGPWGTNVTYRWALATPASGVTVMFDDDASAMPVVTIPELAADTELTFTLTVTGRGGTYGIAPATDTAKVTATDSVIVSGDATLGGLTVNDGTSGLTLAPAFAPGTFVYTASAGNAVATVTLTATVNHADASVSAVTLAGAAIDDHDFADGITVSSLLVGGNEIVVTVTAENGATQTYTVTVSRATTAATAPGVSVSETALTVREEDATGDSYMVFLDTQPTADVTVTVAGHSGTEVTPNPTSLTFTTSNWGTPQTVTVTAAADANLVNETVTLTHSAASADGNYNSITIDDVTVTVNDNDTTNVAPTFDEGASTSRDFNETIGDEAVATAGNIGNPVTATDTGDTLTYSLDGMDKAKFEIISTNGQLQTKVGEKYSHEAQSSYSVTVKVVDSQGASDTIAVTLNVTDQDEAPLAPNTPSVTATSGSTASLDVSWTAPTNTGRPAITNYDLQYQVPGASSWTNGPRNVTNTSTSIPNLDSDTSYEVQVRARNADGAVAWSESGTGRTTAPGGAPTGLTATASGKSQINLSWSAPASSGGSPITGYRIEVSTNGGSTWSDLVANTGNTNRNYSHTGLAGSVTRITRHYRVAAINSTGAGPFSNVANSRPVVTIQSELASAVEGQDIVFTVTISDPIPGNQPLYFGTGIKSIPADSKGAGEWDYRAPRAAVSYIQIGYGVSSAEIRLSTIDDDLIEGTEMFGIGIFEDNRIAVGTPRTALGKIIDNDYKDDADHQQSVDTVPDDTSTTETISAPGSVTGWREDVNDADWYRTTLTEDHCYEIRAGGGTDDDHPIIYGLYRSDGTYLGGTYSYNGFRSTLTAVRYVKVDTTATYYISVGLYRHDGAGAYTLSLTDQGNPGSDCGEAKLGGPPRISVEDAGNSEWPTTQEYLVFNVRLDRRADAPEGASVSYETMDGTATMGKDYERTSGLLVFKGESSKMILVPIIFDSENEDAETMTLVLTSPTGAVFKEDQGVATGTIGNYPVRNQPTGGTSNATEADPLTASFASVPEEHDGENGFNVQIAFSEDVEITPEDMRDHALLVSGGTVTDAAGVDGRKDLWELTVEPAGTGAVSILVPQDRACTETGALCTADGRSLTVSLALRVPGPQAQQANSAATGAPTINGTAQVAETLTADTSGIADADGFTNVSYSYQWIRNDGTSDTDIQNATGSSYPLVDVDEGQTIRVEVSFTDDAGNEETLTSSATGEVAAAVPTEPPGAPRNLTGTANADGAR